uniref:Uncharacterized protein n=1 Tax=Clytia hemisphaerica TaxID=252671 RepID=A0A7M5XC80_9CNID
MLPPKRATASPTLELRGTKPPEHQRQLESTPFEEERRMARQETIRSLHQHHHQNNNNEDYHQSYNSHIEAPQTGVTYIQEDGLVKSHSASLRQRQAANNPVSKQWFDQNNSLRKPTYTQHYDHGIARQTRSMNAVTTHDQHNRQHHYDRQQTSRSLHGDFQPSHNHRSSASSLVVGGEGIKEGTAGQPVTFHLDGRNAGPGQLSCRCRAPSGQMTYVLISDNKDGTYTVDLNASEPGLHTVEVEWDGQPIPGSPFLVRIMQAPDMKKVRAHGPGLLSGIINQFNGNFQVDSKGAGPGTMKVRIHGPKGAFKVEMYRDNPKDRSINVRYNPSEPGLYTANIYWSDEHIVGSPFEIFVAKNEQELNEWRRKAEQSHNGY